MSNKKGIFSELISRKIPHIIGMYIASVWLAVEISEWMSNRFELPQQFATYVFVGMLTFLPSVILIAWGHGKPGKDQWSNLEKAWIPINIILVGIAITYLVNPIKNTNQTKSLLANTNKKVEINAIEPSKISTEEIIKQNAHQSVISYFWKNNTNDKALDWMSYGASWLLSQDLKRTPLISVLTPYGSNNILNELLKKGFKNALDVPLSLAKKIAQTRSAKWLVQGTFKKVDNRLELTASLYDVESGKQIKTITEVDDNWLIALDRISNKIGSVVLTTANVATNVIPELAIMAHTSDNIKAIELLIYAKNSVTFDNDFQAGIDKLFSALKIDESFAQAHFLAMQYYRGLGDFPNAITQAQLALDLDHKLYKENLFLVKASLLGLQGKQSDAVKVLEKWVDLFPENTEALSILANNYLLLGNYQEKAINAYTKLYELEGAGNKALVSLAKIYRLKNDKDNAIKYLNLYKQEHPVEGKAFFELADAYKQFGMLDDAKKMYQEASLFGNKDFKAEIGLANIEAAKGNYKTAVKQLRTLMDKTKTDQQTLAILAVLQEIHMDTGQIIKSLDIIDEMVEPSNRTMPPLQALLQVQGSKIILNANIGKYKEAERITAEVTENLKPPFDKLIGAFNKTIYENQQDVENYKLSLKSTEDFMNSMNVTTMKPDVLRYKGILASWDKDYIKALDYFNQSINETKQSFVTLLTSRQVDDLLYNKSKALFALERYDEALIDLDIILARTPLFAKANHLKAMIYNKTGNQEKLKQELDNINKTWADADPEFIPYKRFLDFQKQIGI